MSLCIAAMAVNNSRTDYQQYIPLFIYFCFKSYPDCSVRILLTEQLDRKYKEIIRLLGAAVNFDMKIEKGYPSSNREEARMLRWVVGRDFFKEYNNVYIADIDVLICRENPSLEEQCLNHCEKTGLPYSNSVRPGLKRLAGRHFVKKNEYYNRTGLIIEKYSKLLRAGKLSVYRDEEVLYKIVDESGLGFPDGCFYPHHGLHLGLWRGRVTGKRCLAIEGGRNGNYDEYFAFYESVKHDNLYKEVVKAVSFREKESMERFMHSFVSEKSRKS